MLEHFEPLTAIGMSAPCFVRKVDTTSDCGRDEQIPEHRVPEILQKVLKLDEGGCLSVYLIENATSLVRVVFAINEVLRRHVTQKVLLVPLALDEVDGIQHDQTDGECLCTFAKKRHYDLRPTEKQRHDLALLLAQRDRRPHKIDDKLLKRAKPDLETAGCRSVYTIG